MEKLLLGDFLGLGMMADEDDLHIVIFCAQEAYHPEVEATSDILLEFAHTAADVHHGYHYSVRLIANRGFPHFKAEVFRLDILELGISFGGIALHVF